MPSLNPRNQLITPEAFEEALPPMAAAGTVDRDEHFYRRVGAPPTMMPEWKQRQAIFASRYLYQFNQHAHRMVEMLRDYVVGNIGFEVKADDQQVQEVIDEFWTHRHNRFDQDWIPRYTLSLSVDGELILPVSVSRTDPVPLVGYISPLVVKRIDPIPFRPGSASQIAVSTAPGEEDIIYPVLGRQSIDELKTIASDVSSGTVIAGVFYISVNNLADHPRGLPDLFVVSDDLEQYTKTNWARMRKAEQEGMYVWDIEIAGASQVAIDDFEKKMILNPPSAGGYRVHNDRVTWQTVQPQGSGTDASNELRYHRSNISSSFGLPDFFVTGESGAGRMATSELWSTVIATAGSRQREMKVFVREIIDFALDWAIVTGRLKDGVDRKFHVTAPVIGIRDLQRMAGMIRNFLDSVLTMYERKILGEDSVRGMLRTLLSNLGFELKDEELGAMLSQADLDQQKAERAIENQVKQAKMMPEPKVPPIGGPPGAKPPIKKPAAKAPAKTAAKPVAKKIPAKK